jgi:hypothetical protein
MFFQIFNYKKRAYTNNFTATIIRNTCREEKKTGKEETRFLKKLLAFKLDEDHVKSFEKWISSFLI